MTLSRFSRTSIPLYAAVVLCVLLLAGLGFRVAYLRNVSLHVDEFVSLLAIRGILEHGYPLLPSGTLYEQALLFSYLEAGLMRVLGFGAVVGRAFSVALSLATVALLYYVGTRLFSKPVGLVAATLGAFSTESIAWGARVRMYATLQFLILLSVWFLWRGCTERDGARYRWIAVICYLAALFTHPVSVLLYVPLLLGLLLLMGPRGVIRPDVIVEAGMPLVGIAATFLLKAIGQPGQLEALTEARPYLLPSLDAVGGFRPISSFFLAAERVPLSILCGLGLAVVVLAFVIEARARKGRISLGADLRPSSLLYVILALTVLEMVFVVGPTWRDSRYLFMVEPFFFLTAAWMAVLAVSWLSRRLKHARPAWLWGEAVGDPISRPLTCMLVLGSLLLLVPAARETVTQQEWGYDLAFEELGEQWREGDIVVTIVPFACELYLPQCDYYASGRAYEEYVFDKSGVLVDRWVGAPLLSSAAQLEDVLRGGSRVWFVVDGWRLAARFDLDFIRTVVEQMDVVEEVQGVRLLRAQGFQQRPEPEVGESLAVTFGEQIALTGYELSSDALSPSSELCLTLYWKALEPVAEEYTVFVHLRGPGGSLVCQDDYPPLENLYPTYYWAEDETVPDPRRLTIPGDVVPGWYRLEVGLYRSGDGVRLAVGQEAGSSEGDFVVLDYVWVGGDEELAAAKPLAANLGDQVLLMGHDGVPRSVEAGQDLHLTLYWQALGGIAEDYTIFVHLRDEGGRTVAQYDGQPAQGFYPTSRWDVGETVRDEIDLAVESGIPPGQYQVVAGMYLLSTRERLPVLDAEGEVIGDTIRLGEVTVIGD
jgi:4-amino-4-deoxy-L-arabinose transferase-like glycosyltransferase